MRGSLLPVIYCSSTSYISRISTAGAEENKLLGQQNRWNNALLLQAGYTVVPLHEQPQKGLTPQILYPCGLINSPCMAEMPYGMPDRSSLCRTVADRGWQKQQDELLH
jgi:hypothetical protein